MRGGAASVSTKSEPADSAAYHDRLRSPAATVELVRPHFASLGITRIARQTGLDRVGIPCFAAFRPNSRSIACNQGKGVDDDAARASAVMEAVEFAIAEAPKVPRFVAAARDLTACGATWIDPAKSLPLGEALDQRASIRWLGGRRLRDGAEVFVPLERAAFGVAPADLPTICQNTNGLASGNTAEEAIFHGLCELVERDANTLWSFMPAQAKQARCLAAESFEDSLILDLQSRFEAAGLVLRLFDQTTDLGIPTVLAVSAPAGGVMVKHFDVASGAGTHPNAARAALRAITEAAQTRVTSIAAARDDIRPDSYRLDGSAEALELVAALPRRRMQSEPARRYDVGDLLDRLIGKLAQHGVDDMIAVSLGGEELGISVVRVVSNLLEDRGPNAFWKPGRRALSALLGQ